MADQTPNLPPTTVPVLDGNNALTLPWRKALQQTTNTAASGITQLTGAVLAGPGGGVQAAELSDTGVMPGSYANANFTVGADGRISVAANGSSPASDPDPLTFVNASLLDGAFTSAAAYKLARKRTLAWTGDAAGGPTVFDGTADVSTALTLANTAVTPGTYGDATHVGQFTVDSKGRLTFAQNVAISATGGTAYAPMSNGAEPPSIVDNGAGEFVMVPYTP